MVQLSQAEQILENGVGLVFCDTNNTLGEVRVDEDRLPARDGVGTNDGVNGLEVRADVAWGSAGSFTQLVAERISDVLEEAGFVDGFKCLEVFGEGGGEAVVYFISTKIMCQSLV